MIYIALSIMFLVLTYFGLKNPLYVLYPLVFLSPWSGIDIDLGLRVTAYLLCTVAVLVVFSILALSRRLFLVSTISRNPWLLIFFVYGVLASLGQSFLVPDSAMEGSAARGGQFRSFSQLAMFGMSLIPVFLISSFIGLKEHVVKCAKIYLWSVATLAALGYLQLVIWYSTGTDPFPIGFFGSLFSGAPTRSGVEWVGSSAVYRMSSFAGEPKGLAVSLVVGLLIIQATNALAGRKARAKRMINILWLFLFTALILTWSTSGAFLWLIGTIALSIFGAGSIRKIQIKKSLFLTLFLLMIVGGGGYALIKANPDKGGVYLTVAESRFVDRSPIEDFDETVLGFLLANPDMIILGVGLGNIHFYAAPYIPAYARYYMEGNIFVAKSGYLRIISELGVIGLVLFSAAYFSPVFLLRKRYRAQIATPYDRYLVDAFTIFASVMFVMGMARTYVWPQMYMTMGLSSALLYVLSTQITLTRERSDNHSDMLRQTRSRVG